MLPTFVYTLTVNGKVFICHYNPLEDEKGYIVHIRNHTFNNAKFTVHCNNGVWSITSDAADEILKAEKKFIEPIEARLKDCGETVG